MQDDDPYMTNARPNVRNLLGVFILLFGLMLYAFAAAAIGDWLEAIGIWTLVQMPYYLVAGLLWLWPTKYLLAWIGRGNKKGPSE